MSDERYKPAKIFTAEEANARLPLVRAITADLVKLSRELIERRQRLEILKTGRESSSHDPYGEELAQVEKELERDAEHLKEYADELLQLGVEPKSAPDGLVDFPAMMDGRLVYLCWKYDEPEVLYWHELNAGFGGRQPLTVGSVAEDDVGEADGALGL